MKMKNIDKHYIDEKNSANETNQIVSLISSIRHDAHKFILDELKKSGITGLVMSHGEILVQLFSAKEAVTMQMLAKGARRDKSTITSLVNKLLQFGYIEKKQSDQDKRVTYILLTEKGKALKPVFKEISADLIKKVYGDMSQSEKELVVSLLERIANNLINHRLIGG